MGERTSICRDWGCLIDVGPGVGVFFISLLVDVEPVAFDIEGAGADVEMGTLLRVVVGKGACKGLRV